MPQSNQISRPQDQELHIVALLSTERGRRSALLSSVQCLLSVVGSMGIILLFAGIPQLIYSPVVTVTNVVTFLMGALLLSVMVAGNACIGYKFRAEIEQIRGELRESQATEEVLEDKPPSYDELTFGDALPPDYNSAVTAPKTALRSMSEESSYLVEVVPTHVSRPLSVPSSTLWHPIPLVSTISAPSYNINPCPSSLPFSMSDSDTSTASSNKSKSKERITSIPPLLPRRLSLCEELLINPDNQQSGISQEAVRLV